jgi:hypothetical protein
VADGRSDIADRARDGVAYVCGHLDRIRADLDSNGSRDPSCLEQLIAAVRDGQDPSGPLDALHTALLVAGDALGVYGNTRGLKPIGTDVNTAAETIYVCPTRQCSRYSWPEGVTPPHCEITAKPMCRVRL